VAVDDLNQLVLDKDLIKTKNIITFIDLLSMKVHVEIEAVFRNQYTQAVWEPGCM
jgi:hypothetical protein